MILLFYLALPRQASCQEEEEAAGEEPTEAAENPEAEEAAAETTQEDPWVSLKREVEHNFTSKAKEWIDGAHHNAQNSFLPDQPRDLRSYWGHTQFHFKLVRKACIEMKDAALGMVELLNHTGDEVALQHAESAFPAFKKSAFAWQKVSNDIEWMIIDPSKDKVVESVKAAAKATAEAAEAMTMDSAVSSKWEAVVAAWHAAGLTKAAKHADLTARVVRWKAFQEEVRQEKKGDEESTKKEWQALTREFQTNMSELIAKRTARIQAVTNAAAEKRLHKNESKVKLGPIHKNPMLESWISRIMKRGDKPPMDLWHMERHVADLEKEKDVVRHPGFKAADAFKKRVEEARAAGMEVPKRKPIVEEKLYGVNQEELESLAEKLEELRAEKPWLLKGHGVGEVPCLHNLPCPGKPRPGRQGIGPTARPFPVGDRWKGIRHYHYAKWGFPDGKSATVYTPPRLPGSTTPGPNFLGMKKTGKKKYVW